MNRILSALVIALALTAPVRADPFGSLVSFFTYPHSTGAFIGLRSGYATRDVELGANSGWDFGLLRAELDYDRLGFRNTSSNMLTGNLVAQLPIGRLTPYALAGAGYQFSNSPGYFYNTANWASRSAVWNVGAGLRYSLTQNMELDGRYRLVQPIKGFDYNHPFQKNSAQSIFTIGLNAHF